MQIASTTVATLALILSIVSLISQRYQTSFILRANTPRDLTREFFFQQHMRHARFKVSSFMLTRLEGAPQSKELIAEGYQLMDYFDTVACYYNRAALDKEMAFTAYFYFLTHYWRAIGEDIKAFERETRLRAYANVARMADDLLVQGRTLNKIPNNYEISPDDFRRFIKGEISQCRPEK